MQNFDHHGDQECYDHQSTRPALSCKSPKPTRKNVSFCAQARCKRSLHWKNYTQYEIEASYWGAEEYARIRQDLCVTMKLIRAGLDVDETHHYCRRGLERGHPQSRSAAYRREAIQGVLEEQRRQRQRGINDTDLLSTAYSALSHTSEASARLLGLADAKDALAQQVVVQSEHSSWKDVADNRLESSPKRTRMGSPTLRQFLPPVA